MSLHKTQICVVKSLVKVAAVSWHSLRRFIKPAPVISVLVRPLVIEVDGTEVAGQAEILGRVTDGGETNAVATEVELCVESTNENVS